MILCEHHNCTGCSVCQAVCHKEAISFTIDELGFRYPVIDNTLCVECGACANVCPSLNPIAAEKHNDCYLAWAKDDTIHYESASGGISTVLNQHFVNGGGFAIGCSWDANMNAVMAIVESETELKRIQGSKYVMSYIPHSTWSGVNERLKSNKHGIFIGLPCQTAAMKKFTNNHPNILCCDLLCHGGCSPKCFDEHVHHIERTRRGGGLSDIKFRGGKYDCQFTAWCDGKLIYKVGQYADSYFYSFMKHSLFRESCYQCQYATSKRVSDITIADYWGIDPEFVKDKNTLNGTNLVIVHSDKGRRVWDEMSNLIESYRRPIEEAIAGNDTLKGPTNCPSDRNEIIRLIRETGFENALNHDKIYRHNNNRFRVLISKILYDSKILSVMIPSINYIINAINKRN